jgi:hypothetical protein
VFFDNTWENSTAVHANEGKAGHSFHSQGSSLPPHLYQLKKLISEVPRRARRRRQFRDHHRHCRKRHGNQNDELLMNEDIKPDGIFSRFSVCIRFNWRNKENEPGFIPTVRSIIP